MKKRRSARAVTVGVLGNARKGDDDVHVIDKHGRRTDGGRSHGGEGAGGEEEEGDVPETQQLTLDGWGSLAWSEEARGGRNRGRVCSTASGKNRSASMM